MIREQSRDQFIEITHNKLNILAIPLLIIKYYTEQALTCTWARSKLDCASETESELGFCRIYQLPFGFPTYQQSLGWHCAWNKLCFEWLLDGRRAGVCYFCCVSTLGFIIFRTIIARAQRRGVWGSDKKVPCTETGNPLIANIVWWPNCGIFCHCLSDKEGPFLNAVVPSHDSRDWVIWLNGGLGVNVKGRLPFISIRYDSG